MNKNGLKNGQHSGNLDLKDAVKYIQACIANNGSLEKCKRITKNKKTFPKLPVSITTLYKNTNKLKSYTSTIMWWFLNPFGLKSGTGSCLGWNFVVYTANFVLCGNLLEGMSDKVFIG